MEKKLKIVRKVESKDTTETPAKKLQSDNKKVTKVSSGALTQNSSGSTSTRTVKSLLKPSVSSVTKIKSNPSKSSAVGTANNKLTTSKTSNKYESSPRIKRINESVKPNFTNVTVRSPPMEQVGLKEKKVKEEDVDIENFSRHHSRYKTRTLEPTEVKVLKIDDKKQTTIKKQLTISSKPVAKPEAFYIPLEEKFVKPEEKNKVPIDSVESDTNSYEEDFESYESDFDSYASSDRKDSASINDISVDGDLNDDKLGNVPIVTNTNINEETIFDSGSYDLKIESKKSDQIQESSFVVDDADAHKMPSYTDEGFEDNSGGFSSTSNSTYLKIDEGKSVLDVLSHVKKYNQQFNYYQQRAYDMSNLITFDNVEYSLFEISPIPYEVFIKTYGKGNVIQRSSQTNDEYIDDFIQTDPIHKQNKWTQFPVDYSKFDITSKIVTTQNRGLNNLKNTLFHEFLNPNKADSFNNEIVIEIKPFDNPLEIFQAQRLGCSTNDEKSLVGKVGGKLLYDDHKHYKRLNEFIGKVGKFMLGYLNETTSLNNSLSKYIKSDFSFSDRFSSPLKLLMNNVDYLQNRPPSLVSVCSSNTDLLLTLHPNMKSNPIQSRTLLCLWDTTFQTELNKPTNVLLSVDNVSECKIYHGSSGYVVAGTDDGLMCVWDLEENDMWHHFITNAHDDEIKNANHDGLVLRSCSFSVDLNQNQVLYGAVVDISMYQSQKEDKQNRYDQIYVLQELGLMTIWTVVRSSRSSLRTLSSEVFTDAHSQSSSSYWSTIKFFKHLTVNVKESMDILSIFNNGDLEKKFVKKSSSYQEFPLTNVKRKNSYKRAITPRSSNDIQDDSLEKRIPLKDSGDNKNDWEMKLKCSSFKILQVKAKLSLLIACSSGRVLHYDERGNLQHPQVFTTSGSTSLNKCIEICHHNLPYFLVGCDNHIDMFSLSNPKPIKSFYNGNQVYRIEFFGRHFREEIICIEWSKLRPCLFLTLSNRGNLTVWDLLKSDLMPVISEALMKGSDSVTSMNLVLDEKNTPKKEYLILFYSSGLIEKHEISKDLSASLHQNMEVETLVLEKYLNLL